MKCPRKLRGVRKILWILHEMISMMGPVIWIDHREQEIKEAAEDAKEGRGE